MTQNFCCYSHHMQVHNNLLPDKTQHLMIENVPGLLYPKSILLCLVFYDKKKGRLVNLLPAL